MADGGTNMYNMLGNDAAGASGNDNNDGNGSRRNNNNILDSMLEILPEELDVNLFNAFGSDSHSHSQTPVAIQHTAQLQHETYDSLFSTGTTTEPIDIVNHQNGEIAQLWDFNVDEFMMTPSNSSDSATISAPGSFNSENPVLASHGETNQNNTNWNHLLSMGTPFDTDLSGHARIPPTQSFFTNTHSGNNSQTTLRGNSDDTHFRPTLPSRRSSSQLTKTLMAEDGGISLSSSTTTNSVRKNSLARPISSTSLSSYRKGSIQGGQSGNASSMISSSIPKNPNSVDMPKKPQVQCFNCKTFKTPLWRRDPQGNTLCNACGLFQKLHGTMRPLSLKSDVIKKRNTKKRTKKGRVEEGGINGKNNNNNSNSNSNSNHDSDHDNNYNNNITHNNPAAAVSTRQASNIVVNTTPLHTKLKNRKKSTTPAPSMQEMCLPSTPTNGPSTNLNSNLLMNHNKRMSTNVNGGNARKSRRSSASSSASNSSNKSSSSRPMVPILPKPSPSGTSTNNFNFAVNGPNSAGNSAASSPRYSNSPRLTSGSFAATSPLPAGSAPLSSSTGRSGITIPRRKSSRTLISSSSSFMAASLQLHHQMQQQQTQQQQQQQQQQPVGSSSSTISAPSSWNSTNNTRSPKTARSPRSPFDFFSSSQDQQQQQQQPPQSRPPSRKSHTSLLSQQLQSSVNSSTASNNQLITSQPTSRSQTPTSFPPANVATPQPSSLKRTSVTASPRSSYIDSIQQQRGLSTHGNGNTTFYGELSSSGRRTTSLNQSTTDATTPTNSNGKQDNGNVMDDLEWLKFGM